MDSTPSGPARNYDGGQTDSTPPVDAGLQSVIALALQPLMAELHGQFSLIAGRQADLLVEPIHKTMEHYLNQAFDAASQSLSQQVSDAVDAVRASMQDQVSMMLDPLEATVHRHVEETVSQLWSVHTVEADTLDPSLRTDTVHDAVSTAQTSTSRESEDKPMRSSTSSGRRAKTQREEAGGAPSADSASFEGRSKQRRRMPAQKTASTGESDAAGASSGNGRAPRSPARKGSTRTGTKKPESATSEALTRGSSKSSSKAPSSPHDPGGRSSSKDDIPASGSRSHSAKSSKGRPKSASPSRHGSNPAE